MDVPAPSPKRRASRKTDAERGPLGAWSYNTMVELGLSAEQIAMRAGKSAGHIRKIMGGSERDPSARVLRSIHHYFMEVGAAADPPIPVDRPPGLEPDDNRAGTEGDTPAVPAAYLARIDALIAQMAEVVEELRAARQGADATETRLRALEAAAKLRGPSGGGAHQEQSAPHATAE